MISDKVVRSFCSPNDIKGVVSIGCGFCLHLTLTSITRPIPSPGLESYVGFIVLFNCAEGPRDPMGLSGRSCMHTREEIRSGGELFH